METSFSNQIASRIKMTLLPSLSSDMTYRCYLLANPHFHFPPCGSYDEVLCSRNDFSESKREIKNLQCWSHKFFNIVKNSVISQADRDIILQQDEVLQTNYWQVAQQVNQELSLYGLKLWDISGLQIVFLLGIQDLKA